MQKLKSGLTALAVGIVLLAAFDWAATAATGDSMILGQRNRAGQTTTIKNTGDGAALDLRQVNGPPLKVHSDKRVTNLNADQLDGLEASDLRANRNVTYQWSATDRTGGFAQAIPHQQAGSYLVSWSIQLSGAAGSPDNPNVINCRIIQYGVSGNILFQKAVLGQAQVNSIATPPALNGTSPLVLAAGDELSLDCAMTRNTQVWSTPTTQPIVVNLLRVDGTNVITAPLGKTTAH